MARSLLIRIWRPSETATYNSQVGSSALKLVESQPFYRREIDPAHLVGEEDHHSLHELGSVGLGLGSGIKPALTSYLMGRFSKPGDFILDPFCGAGAVGLEASLTRRTAVCVDQNPVAAIFTQAKIDPADITEVTLWLQQASLKRPVPLAEYEEYFSPFYDVNTYRELVNLRQALAGRNDGVTRFVRSIAMSLLHGHSAGYFSAYAFPQVSVSPSEQREINAKRRQTPDFRAVVPRVLKRAAALMRDGYPSVLGAAARNARVGISDPRNLSLVASSSIDLTISSVPASVAALNPKKGELWLERWFAGISSRDADYSLDNGNDWSGFMNETLTELARVTRSGGRAALAIRELGARDGQSGHIDAPEERLVSLVNTCLGSFWDAEGVLFESGSKVQLRDSSASPRGSRVVILRRK